MNPAAHAESTTPPLVEINNVSHFVDGRPILSDICWRICPGEHWALLGPNGAGKTTLLKVICGYLWPNGGGEVLRDGEPRVDLGRLRRHIGWVSSQLATQVPPHERARDTVLSGRLAQIGLKRLPGLESLVEAEGDALAVLGQLGCGHLAERTFGTLSQGEQQKVLIARAYMARRKLLILDEPCAGLDPGARESFLEAIELLARQHGAPSLLLVTHHVEEIMPAVSRTLVLCGGRVLRSGATASVVDEQLLMELYGRPVVRLARRGGRFWFCW